MILHLLALFSLVVVPIFSEEILPKNVIPKHYKVDIEIDSEKLTFSGVVCIEVLCKTDSSKIKLHAKQKHGHLKLNLDSVKINPLKSPKEIFINKKSYDKESDILTLTTTNLESENTYELCMDYVGNIDEKYNYVIWKSELKSPEKFIIATNFQRQYAFPCFDEPALKATFVLQLIIRSREFSYSNRPLKLTEMVEEKKGWKRQVYGLTRNFSPSQISFVVTNVEFRTYEYWFSREWNTQFMYREEVDKKINLKSQLQRSSMFTTSSSLGQSGTLPTVQFIVLPTEKEIYSMNWGLVLISEHDLTSGPRDQKMSKMYDRMAHQYFGVLVSPDTWGSSWMFSALASYVIALQMPKQPYIGRATYLMWQELSDDLDKNMENGWDPYHDVTTGSSKGIMLLRLVHSTLGESQFVKAIEDFIETYKVQSAGPINLWNTFDKWTKKSILPPEATTWTIIMKKWTEQKGYPLISVNNIGNGQFKLKQDRFIGSYKEKKQKKLNNDPTTEESGCWYIPLIFTSAYKAKFEIKQPSPENWLGCGQKKEVSVITNARKDDWVIFNIKYAGLARVKYDTKTWDLIVKAFRTNHEIIDPTVRAQIVNDAVALAWMGDVDYTYVFKLLPYLKKETEYNVWNAFFVTVFNLKEILLSYPDLYKKFQDYLSQIIKPAFEKNYIQNKQYRNTENFFHALDKSSTIKVTEVDAHFYAWSCNVVRQEACRSLAQSKYLKWMYAGYKNIYVNVKRSKRSLLLTVFCSVLSEKDKYWTEKQGLFFEFLKQDFGGKDHRLMFLSVLRCTVDTNTIASLLEWTTSPADITGTQEEKLIGFLDLSKGAASFSPTLDYFYSSIQRIKSNYLDPRQLARIVKGLTSKMTTDDQIRKMKEFVQGTQGLNNNEVLQAFNEGEAIAQLKIQWMIENKHKIRDALTNDFTR